MEDHEIISAKAQELAALSPQEYNDFVDGFEVSMVQNLPAVSPKLQHDFGDGIYRRTICMPAGIMVSSKIHKTRHPYAIHTGAVFVISHGKAEFLTAPYLGMTEPDTRRIILVAADCVWSTCHANPNNETDIDKIEKEIILKRPNPLLACPTQNS